MSKYVVMAGWKDAPHLDEQTIEEMAAAFQNDPSTLEARMYGIPSIGSGAVYQIPPREFVVDPFKIPGHWPVAYGMDVGWNFTAAMWFAWDRDADVVYFWGEYKKGRAEPAVHAHAIKTIGAEWMTGTIDPASKGRSQKDGTQLLAEYRKLGLNIIPADNAVEAGIFQVTERLTSGRLKMFSTMTKTLDEYKLYRRDDNGKIVKQNDHLMDCMRYCITTGLKVATTKSAIIGDDEFQGMGAMNYGI